MNRFFLVLCGILLSLCSLSCKSHIKPIASDTRVVLGTVCTISLYEQGTKEIYDELFLRLQEIENAMSVNIAETEISKVNNYAGIEKVAISKDSYVVLTKALEYARLTNGAFNPTIGPLVKLWSIGNENARVPTQEEIKQAIILSDWKNVTITEENNLFFAYLEKKGMLLDLGGIAKGYAADEMIAILKRYDISSAIIDLGGNIYALGEKQNGDLWRVGIKNPFDSTGAPAIRLDVKNTSVVTSGVYERFFEKNGIRYHHLLSSTTGFPIDTGLMSVTIVSASSMVADVLSTAVFALGQEEGIQFLESLHEKGFCITTERDITSTNTLKGEIIILDDTFMVK